MQRRQFLLFAILASAPALAASPKPVATFPGGVARLHLGASDRAPKATLDGRRVLVRREGDEWVAHAGIPLSAKVKSKLAVEVVYADDRREARTVTVVSKNYLTQHLNVPKDKADLPPQQVAQFEQEREHLRRVLQTFTETDPRSLALLQPVPGRRSGSFGLRRVINGVPRAPHGGLDIAADEGTPILATAAGRVLDAGEYLFLGRVLILDHGQGLLSLYAHLNAVDVAVGDAVGAGATIGKVGMTGRVTGPHLHFSVYLNAASVDPAIFLPRVTE
jgi:murein DD-endopeptidase MepM/ murein hydrolase activator NlpD